MRRCVLVFIVTFICLPVYLISLAIGVICFIIYGVTGIDLMKQRHIWDKYLRRKSTTRPGGEEGGDE